MKTPRQIIEAMTKCSVISPDKDDNLRKLQIDPSKKTDIEASVAKLYVRMRELGTGMNDPRKLSQDTISQINAMNMVRAMEITGASTVKPGAGKGLADMLARDMAVVNKAMGTGDEYTELGWVRESLNRTRRAWRGGISDAFRRHEFVKRIDDLQAGVLKILRERGIRQDQMRYITTNAVEKGFYPILRGTQNLGGRATTYLDTEYARFYDELRNVYNLTSKEADEVLSTGEKAAMIYHYAAGIAHDAGVAVGETEAWGYFPRIMSAEASARFNWKWEDENHIKWSSGEVAGTGETFLRSRTTEHFIVEDEVMLDFILRNLGRQRGDVEYYFKIAAPGIEHPGIGDIMDSRYGLAQVVGSVLENHHPEVVEALLDSHLLSKIPYSTTEVFDYIRDTLKMPFDNLDEVFQVDWKLGMEAYRTQLERVAEESGFVNALVANTVNGGWGVSAIQRMQNMKDYGNFVPLKNVIAPNILKRTFQVNAPGLGEIYVHPTVAQMAKSAQELQMSPYTMGMAARMIRMMNRTFRQLALATIEYIPRQIWQNMVSLGAAGGDMLKMPYNTSRLLLYQLAEHMKPGSGAKLFNNTKRIYKMADGRMLTEYELYNHLHDVGFLSRFEPLTGNAPGTVYNPTSLRNTPNTWGRSLKRNMRYLAHTFTEEGLGRTLESVQRNVGDVFDTVSFPIAFSNTLMNNAAAFTAVESMSRVYGVGAPSHFLRAAGRLPSGGTFQAFNTVDEALEHAKNFFFFYDDLTYYDRVLRNHVIPFWGYFSKAIPSAFRYMVRNPSKFVAHQRLYALANLPVDGDERLNEGSVPGWMMNQSPIFFRVPGGRPGGQDAFFGIPMESIDPINSALSWISEPTVAVLEGMGLWREHSIKSTPDRISEQQWMGTQTNRTINALLEKLFPIWKAGAQQIMGETFEGVPLDEGATVDEFLGFRVAPNVRLWIESMLPVLGTIHRMNPGEFRGTPTTYDSRTGQWTVGKPGWAGVPMSGRDTFNQNNPYRMLQYAGIKVYPVDVAMNMGMSYDQLRISLREGRKFVQKMKEDMVRMPEGQARAQRELEIAQVQYILDETQKDMLRLEAFMQQNGMNPGQAYNTLRGNNVRVGDL